MPSETSVVRDVILPEGTTLRLRAATRDDAAALVAFVERLTPESRYFRFHGLPPVGPRLVEPFLDPDWDERGALVGTLASEAGERIVALGTWSRLRDRSRAEAAFAVDDEVQGHGIGTRLVEQLAGLAAEAGIERFVAEVLPANLSMLRVFEHVGFAVTRELDGGVVEVVFPIAPTESYRETVDSRDHLGVVASLGPFFSPRGVAVYGASPRAGTIGGLVFRNIVEGGFTGDAYPVNRRGEDVAGVAGYTSLAEVSGDVDMAVFCLPGEHVLEAVEDALAKGVRALCVISAGFAEVGSEGAAREARLLEHVRAHGARLIGPNCLGVAAAGPRLNATFAPRAFPPGRIAFSSQSGALGLALLERSEARGLGFSAFVSIGNKADVSSNDLLEFWEEDPATDVVLLYLESFGNPRKFGRLARRISRRKPILAMKSGVSRGGAKAASSHTAALAGSEVAVGSALQAGRRHPSDHGRGIGRCRRDPVDPALAQRTTGRHRDQCRRPRDSLRRRVRGGRARAREPGRRDPGTPRPPGPRRGVPLKPGRSPRLGDRRDVRQRPSSDRRRRRGRRSSSSSSCPPPRWRRPMSPRASQTCEPARRSRSSRWSCRGGAARILPVPGVCRPGAGPGRGARRVAAPARRHRAAGRRDRPRGADAVVEQLWPSEDDAWLAAPDVRELLQSYGIPSSPSGSRTAPRQPPRPRTSWGSPQWSRAPCPARTRPRREASPWISATRRPLPRRRAGSAARCSSSR